MKTANNQAIRCFVEVAERRSFTKAGEFMHLAQPAVSAQIRKLEQSIGCCLLLRSTRAVELTAEGQYLLSAARNVVNARTEFECLARLITRKQKPQLLVGASPYCVLLTEWETLLSASDECTREYEIDVQMEANNELLLERLADGQLELCFFTGASQSESFDSLLLRRWHFELLVPNGHSLAAMNDIALDALRGEPIVIFGRQHSPALYEQLIEAMQSKAQAKIIVPPQSHPLALASYAARHSVLALTLPMLPVPELVQSALVRKPLNGLEVSAETCLLRRREPPAPASVAFWNFAAKRSRMSHAGLITPAAVALQRASLIEHPSAQAA